MECLTRLAVDGLKRLLAQGDFTRPECVQRAVDEYEAENNPIREFLEEAGDITGMHRKLNIVVRSKCGATPSTSSHQ